jgi:hypothetical protein
VAEVAALAAAAATALEAALEVAEATRSDNALPL